MISYFLSVKRASDPSKPLTHHFLLPVSRSLPVAACRMGILSVH